MITGEIHYGMYIADKSTVELDSGIHYITAENDEYIAIFRPGRSVYEALVGSTYLPARVFFCKILERTPEPNPRVSTIKFLVLLESPIRRT